MVSVPSTAPSRAYYVDHPEQPIQARDLFPPDSVEGRLLKAEREAAHLRRLVDGEDEIEEALRELVRLKDGPRDAAYERDKPMAWERARAVLAQVGQG